MWGMGHATCSRESGGVQGDCTGEVFCPTRYTLPVGLRAGRCWRVGEAKTVAFGMATHHRLGSAADAAFQVMPTELIHRIIKEADTWPWGRADNAPGLVRLLGGH